MLTLITRTLPGLVGQSGRVCQKFSVGRMPRVVWVLIAAIAVASCSSADNKVASEPVVQERHPSVARLWSDVLLQAIRNDFARPTVHARNLFHVSAAMYDAWSALAPADTESSPYLYASEVGGFACNPLPGVDTLAIQPAAQVHANREMAASYAAYRLIRHRFLASPRRTLTANLADTVMVDLGFDPDEQGTDIAQSGAAALGNYIADCYIRFGRQDGSNESSFYEAGGYAPVNPAIEPFKPGNPTIIDLNRWQPISLPVSIDQAGNPVSSEPSFLGPHWGDVQPFAMTAAQRSTYQRGSTAYRVYHDPGAPPLLGTESASDYQWGFEMVSIWSAQLDPSDAVMVDISPASLGNINRYPESPVEYPQFYQLLTGGDTGTGHPVNPVTGNAYEPQIVPRGDYARVLAEFWADGPESETPPGHWFVILNTVNDHPLLKRRIGGEGRELGQLEWDVKSYFALGGAMHDAAISAWGIKGWYDYVRPVSAIRAMADLGQRADENDLSYHPSGLSLVDGYIELIRAGDPLAGDNGEHVGKIKLFAWRGPAHVNNPIEDRAGVGWIRAEDWWPYQRPSFVTPPFAGYVSGHSTYSRAAATVLAALTGDEYFPGGMSSFDVPADIFLKFEKGPTVPMRLQWATYRDAADQCSLSRIWGGIHPPADDMPGRRIGSVVGEDAWRKARAHFGQ